MHNVHVSNVRAAHPTEPLDDGDTGSERVDAVINGAPAETAVALSDLRLALLKLSEDQRQVILLVGLEQLSYSEAATILNVPIGTVMSRLARGREQLRRMLAREPRLTGAAPLRRVK